jgi:hypothetical protein
MAPGESRAVEVLCSGTKRMDQEKRNLKNLQTVL